MYSLVTHMMIGGIIVLPVMTDKMVIRLLRNALETNMLSRNQVAFVGTIAILICMFLWPLIILNAILRRF